jgi:protein gp37
MMNMGQTKIEWCNYSLNPVKGRCPNTACPLFKDGGCYAHTMYDRFKWPTQVRFEYAKFRKELEQIKQPKRIFVGSTMELFGPWIEGKWLDLIFEATQLPGNKKHTYIYLTKRPDNLHLLSPYPDNCWIGASVCDGQMLAHTNYPLCKVEAKIKILSLEPLFSRMPVTDLFVPLLQTLGVKWLIMGALTGTKTVVLRYKEKYPDLTPMQWHGSRWILAPKIEWLEQITAAADQANIPVFFKDNLEPLFENTLPKWAVSGDKLRQEFPKVG